MIVWIALTLAVVACLGLGFLVFGMAIGMAAGRPVPEQESPPRRCYVCGGEYRDDGWHICVNRTTDSAAYALVRQQQLQHCGHCDSDYERGRWHECSGVWRDGSIDHSLCRQGACAALARQQPGNDYPSAAEARVRALRDEEDK